MIALGGCGKGTGRRSLPGALCMVTRHKTLQSHIIIEANVVGLVITVMFRVDGPCPIVHIMVTYHARGASFRTTLPLPVLLISAMLRPSLFASASSRRVVVES
jgi:hypothetical protein